MSTGMFIGAAIGIVTDRIGTFMCMGMIWGMIFGSILGKRKNNNKNDF
jgi:F0F1-type ATP synthase assembly protein I